MERKETVPDVHRPIRRILAIGDIHQAPNLNEIEAAIERIAPDTTVFTGDYFDSFTYDDPDNVRRTAVWLKQGIHRRDRVYLLGNHDLPYAYPHLATCPGWTPEKQRIISMVLEENDWLRFRLSYSPSSSWLFTHAGVSAQLVPPGITDVAAWVADQEAVALAFLELGRPHWMLRGGTRRGDNSVGGPLWCDISEFEPTPGLNQVFGHTPASQGEPLIRMKADSHSINVCIDASSPQGVRSVMLLNDGAPSEVALPAFNHPAIKQARSSDGSP
jgi:hypothetical protein